ncbi:MAG: hypothetical protein U1E65_24415 [Myxococcota bacterium]
MIRRALLTWALTWACFLVYSAVLRRTGLYADVPSLIVTYLALERAVLPGAVLAAGVGYLGDVFSGAARGQLTTVAVLAFFAIRLGVSKFSGARWLLVSIVGFLTVCLSLILGLWVEAIFGPNRASLHAEVSALAPIVLANLLLSYPVHRLFRLADEWLVRPEDDLVFRP